jgi:hypothetical protein
MTRRAAMLAPISRGALVSLVLTILLSIASTSFARDMSELGSCDDETQPDREAKGRPELPPATFTIDGLTMSKSHVTDAEAKFGPSTKASRAYDENGHGMGVCYRSSKWPADPIVLTFTTGTIAGFDELIGFELRFDKSANAAGCVTSDLVRSDLETSNGLRLGMSQSDMQKILGPAIEGPNGFARWLHEGTWPTDPVERKRSGNDYYLTASGVIARFRDSKSECISAYVVESY